MDETKVAYAIWNRRDIYQAEVRDLLRDIDFATDSVIVPKVNSDLMSLIADAADNMECTHLVIYASGTMIKHNYALDTAWHAHCRSEWLVSGHILLRPTDQYPYLHEQTLAINLQRWKDYGRPAIGHSETGKKVLPAFERSDDNIHDDYTPLWLKPSNANQISTTKRRFGWNILSTSLDNQLPVVNIPIEIRNEKIYVYPDDNGDQLARIISDLRTLPSLPIPFLENDSQRKFVEWMSWMLQDDATTTVFVFNTGQLWWGEEYGLTTPDSIWTTASGFKSFVEWYMRGAPQHCVIDTYDRNPGSLRLWQHIHRSWNGNDFYDFMRAYDQNCDSEEIYCWGNKWANETIQQCCARQIEEIAAYFGGHANMLQHWHKFQQLEHRYHHCDIVANHQTILDNLLENKKNLIWLNNIFFFRRNILKYGILGLNQRLGQLTKLIHTNAPDTKIWGQCSVMDFGHLAGQIAEQLDLEIDPQHQCDMYINDDV
jgi:hypothetical protein